MAFNFNWSPLTADADFYQRATDLLTGALNKSPKPPIIVDDIIVTELNLGNQAPDLDILEIGDIADDRFRGIFKMSYRGDAFLTLRTKVQANPLNTYLSSKPDFTSPSPLAAQSGLTIPLSITLSEFKLSGFVILVFSKQKGLTIVFRNDPLESLKVSSTFDSISFVRDYLQKTIEGQLRNLFMEELPAIIHRLSLRLWCPDQVSKEDGEGPVEGESEEAAIDPLANPPDDAIDAEGNFLDSNDIANLSLEGEEMPSSFSQSGMLGLSALQTHHQTFLAFCPGLRDAIWRAVAGWERPDPAATPPVLTPSVTKTYSFSQGQSHSVTSYTFSETSSTANGQNIARPSLSTLNSSSSVLSSASAARSRSYMGNKKPKRRVVRTPLRRSKTETASGSEANSETGETTGDSGSVQGPSSEPFETSIPEEPEEEVATPEAKKDSLKSDKSVAKRPTIDPDLFTPPTPEVPGPNKAAKEKAPVFPSTPQRRMSRRSDKSPAGSMGSGHYPDNSVILEQAWISKMASEIARRVYDEKARNGDFWAEQPDGPPPAYEAQ